MQISLTKPEMEEFVAQQVSAGHFASPEEVIEAGLARLMLDPDSEELDAETLAAIEEGNAQIERGEGIDFDEFAAEMRKKYSKQ
jgi:antitoxin ParD1/3/4